MIGVSRVNGWTNAEPASAATGLGLDGFALEEVLEPEQMARMRRRPLERRRVGPALLAVMWLLRIYVFLALPLVAYVFFASLRSAGAV